MHVDWTGLSVAMRPADAVPGFRERWAKWNRKPVTSKPRTENYTPPPDRHVSAHTLAVGVAYEVIVTRGRYGGVGLEEREITIDDLVDEIVPRIERAFRDRDVMEAWIRDWRAAGSSREELVKRIPRLRRFIR